MAAEIKSVTMAQAKEIIKDKTIDRDEAQKLGLSTQEAESLTKGLQAKIDNLVPSIYPWHSRCEIRYGFCHVFWDEVTMNRLIKIFKQ